MNINKEGIEFIKKWEGLSLKPYRCASGVLTIGYGHTKGVSANDVITKEKADCFLKEDLKRFEKSVNRYVGRYSFNQQQFNALVSFTFNCGENNLCKLIGQKTLNQIADDLLLYTKSNGHIVQGLVNRRKAEYELFTSGCDVEYFPKFEELNFKQALEYMNIDSSFENRKKIAVINGLTNYTGRYDQNIYLFNLLKKGTLKKGV